jgi:DNA polymerase beta
MATKKIVIRIKPVGPPAKIDLRNYGSSNQPDLSNKKQLIINVMTQLIEHTEAVIKSCIGEDKKKYQFKLTQFKKALSSIKSCPHEITSGTQAKELPGIGKGIGARIDEILKTGTLTELNEVRVTDDKTRIINELTTVTGIGEANALRFIEQGVTGLDDLRSKVEKGVIKLTHHMEIGLKYYLDIQTKIPFQEVLEIGKMMKSCIGQLYPDVMMEICGSHRRKLPLSGDIDVLLTHQKIMTEDDLIMSPVHYLKDIVRELRTIGLIVDDLTSQGDTKYMGVCMHPVNRIGRRIDIRFVTYSSYYPALVYFTGSMMLNKTMRTIALQKGYTLNEYGLYRIVSEQKNTLVPVNSERDIFDLLDLVYLEPEQREIK